MSRKGFTLVELIATAMVIAVLATATAAIVVTSIQLFIYIPQEMKARSAAQDILDTMINGQNTASQFGSEGLVTMAGMLSAVSVVDASTTQFTYITGYPGAGDQRIIRITYDNGTGKIYRQYTALGDTGSSPTYSSQTAIPYYGSGDVTVTGVAATPTSIFTYYKANGASWVSGTDALTTIARVDIAIVAASGSGSAARGSFESVSGVSIKQYI